MRLIYSYSLVLGPLPSLVCARPLPRFTVPALFPTPTSVCAQARRLTCGMEMYTSDSTWAGGHLGRLQVYLCDGV